MSYKNFGQKEVDFRDKSEVQIAYENGFVFTRTAIGHMERVRSLRVNLSEFAESSENRRILRKFEYDVSIQTLPYKFYTWEIHKLGKDFYETKFGPNIFSANKIKELFTTENNFNSALTFCNKETDKIEGYCICYSDEDKKFLHYAYPFYKLDLINSNFGMYMMTRTISYLKERGFEYIYLGSVHESSALYKLQFSGLEWWDEKNEKWNSDLEELKSRVRETV